LEAKIDEMTFELDLLDDNTRRTSAGSCSEAMGGGSGQKAKAAS